MRGYGKSTVDGYAKFFEACKYVENVRSFMTTAQQIYPVVRNALFQNMMYHEPMIEIEVPTALPPGYEKNFKMSDLKTYLTTLKQWVESYVTIYKDELYKSSLEVADMLSKETQEIQIGTNGENKLARLNVPITSLDSVLPTRYRVQVMRTNNNARFFAECFGAMALQHRDDTVVCLVIVGPEHDPRSAEHFDDQCKMISFLCDKLTTLYSTPEKPFRPYVSWHAGELIKSNSSPDVMRGRITKSIINGHAFAIGHGVSLSEDGDDVDLIDLMRSRKVCVETCLSSNDMLLNVSGEQHPFETYLSHGVPVTLCVDDGGIFRRHITDEFVRAVQEHKISYLSVKTILRNGLQYSRLRGESIWIDDEIEKGVRSEFVFIYEREWEPGEAAIAIMERSEKAKMQVKQERKIRALEERWASIWYNIKQKMEKKLKLEEGDKDNKGSYKELP